MSAFRARAEFDPRGFGVKIAVAQAVNESEHRVLIWGDPVVRTVDRGVVLDEDAFLHLDEDAARAMYEALADYFGGTGHDTRALRKDYDAERARVDKFIAHITTGASA